LNSAGFAALREEMMTTVVVFGGTGFLGRRLVHRLAAAGAIVRVAVRHPEGARSALPAADLTQVTFFRADVREPTSIAAAMAGADAVVNAVSAYVEKGGVTFESVHVQGAETVARGSLLALRLPALVLFTLRVWADALVPLWRPYAAPLPSRQDSARSYSSSCQARRSHRAG
jgi:NAD(P)-dependent dehydrogenase (short-subunit alcohol dehydrogenase family)